MIPRPSECSWIDPAVKPYNDEDLAVLSVLCSASNGQRRNNCPSGPVS